MLFSLYQTIFERLHMKKKLIFSCLGLFLLSASVQAEALSKEELKNYLSKEELQNYLTEHKCQITKENSTKVISGENLESNVTQSYGTGPKGESVSYGYLTIYLGSGKFRVMNMEKVNDAGIQTLKLKFAPDLQNLAYSTAQEFVVSENNYWRINLGYPNKNRILSCNNE